MKSFGKLLDMEIDIKTKGNTNKITQLLNIAKTTTEDKEFVSTTKEIVKELETLCNNKNIINEEKINICNKSFCVIVDKMN